MSEANPVTARPPVGESGIIHFINDVERDLDCIEKEGDVHGTLRYQPFGIKAVQLKLFADTLRHEGKKVKVVRLPGILYRLLPLATFTIQY